MSFHPGSAASRSAADRKAHRRQLGIWLLIVAGMVFVMVVIGGITRLTESGLSIVEWRPVTGTLPPLNEVEWQAEFQKYQSSPQYRQINAGMSLDDFKSIFWWEYVHRLWGRLIGVAFALPLLVFFVLRRIEPQLLPRLVGLLFLGGAQGALGWFMVASGLVDRPAVSHYRLAAHLSLAVLIYLALLWNGWRLLGPDIPARRRDPAEPWAWAMLGLIALQIVLGALVAGLRAGLTYNTWPLMDGRFFPEGAFLMTPLWLNFIEHIPLVQFEHRLGAYVVTVAALLLAWLVARQDAERPVREAAGLLSLAVIGQVVLGIATLLAVVPVWLGAAHQAGALAVATAGLWLVFRLRYRP